MTAFQKNVLALVRAALDEPQSVELPADFDWNAALALGKAHQIVPLLYYGAVRAGVSVPSEPLKVLKEATRANIIIDEKQRHAVGEILRAFSENGIDHLPLKGTVIKSLYPSPELRPMGDADILIREEQYEQIRPILLSFGFSEGVKSPHEYIWTKKDTLFLELHHRTFAPRNREFVRFYGDGWLKAKPCADDPHRYAMDDEATLAYLVTHLAKHYRDSGVGIRHLLDIRMFLRAKPELNSQRLHADLSELKLEEFYGNLLKTLSAWFDGGEETEVTELITNRVFESGAYGTQVFHTVTDVTESVHTQSQFRRARWHWMFVRIFPSYSSLCRYKYPWLKRCPILLPVMWIVRLFEILLFKTEKIGKAKTEFGQMTPELLDAQQKERHAVGLHFAFEDE